VVFSNQSDGVDTVLLYPNSSCPSVEFSVFLLLEEHFLKNRGVIRRPSYEPYGQIVRDLVIGFDGKAVWGKIAVFLDHQHAM